MVSYGHLPEADAEIEAACRRSHARLWPVDFDLLTSRSVTLEGRTFDYGPLKELKIPLLANYQPKNAAVAVTALSVLAHKGWHITEQHIREGFAAVQWPGRFEVLGNHPVFLLDGSHNPQGIAATADSLRELFPEQKFVFLLSIMADKDVDTMLSTLAPLAQQCFTVAADNPRATPPAVLRRNCRNWAARRRAAPPFRRRWPQPRGRRAMTGGSAPWARSISPEMCAGPFFRSL